MLNSFRPVGVKIISMAALAGLTVCALGPSAQAAEQVTLKVGAFRRTVSVDSLKNFASTGTATGGLASLLGVVGSTQRQSFTGLLRSQLPYDVLAVDRILKSPLGQKMLEDVAKATILPGEKSEVLALRSTALATAAEHKSLSFVTLIENYPTPNLTVDLPLLQKTLAANQSLGALLGGQGAPSGGATAPTPPSN